MPDRAIDRDTREIEHELTTLAARHPRFIDKGLGKAEKLKLESFAKDYAAYEELVGNNLPEISRPEYLTMPMDQWKQLGPQKRYIEMEKYRAKSLRNLYDGWQMIVGGLSEGPCLDIGARSAFFAESMNAYSINQTYGRDAKNLVNIIPGDVILESLTSPWYSTDIPLTKDLPVTGTDLDRKNAPGFAEIGSDGKLPHPGIQFEAITLNMVLHHVDPGQLEDLLEEAYKRLKPGGTLFVLEDVIGWDKEEPVRKNVIKGIDKIFYLDSPGNQKPMSEWREMIEKVGFKHKHNTKNFIRNVVGIPVEEGMMAFTKPQ